MKSVWYQSFSTSPVGTHYLTNCPSGSKQLEGAELQILSSIDWSRVSFDVLCVEVQSSEDTNQAIRQLLSAQVLTLLALLAQKCKH